MSKNPEINRAKKAALLLKTISSLFYQAVRDDNRLGGLSITRVELSPDKSHCYILFYDDHGEALFSEKLKHLVLYKPSLRAALAKSIAGRYTPELIFKFDSAFAKSQKVEALIQNLKDKGEI